MKRRLYALLPHGCIVLSLTALVITVADGINSKMGFLISTPGRAILLAANTLTLVFCLLYARNRR